MTKFSIKSLKSEIDKAGNPIGQFEINQLKPGQPKPNTSKNNDN